MLSCLEWMLSLLCVRWLARVWLKAPAAANNVTNNSKKAKSCCWEKCSLCQWPGAAGMGKLLFHLYGLCGPSRREQPSSPNATALVLVFWESNKPCLFDSQVIPRVPGMREAAAGAWQGAGGVQLLFEEGRQGLPYHQLLVRMAAVKQLLQS